MAELKITDLVDQSAIDGLKNLSKELQEVKTQYESAARKMLEGLKIKVEFSGDVEKLNAILSAGMKEAEQGTTRLNTAMQQQQTIVQQTTNAISRKLAEQEKLNAATRDAVKADESLNQILHDVIGTLDSNISRLASMKAEMNALKEAYKNGEISSAEFLKRERELKIGMQELNGIINNQQKIQNAAAGSYQHTSLQLELLKKAYKQLTDEEKRSPVGEKMLGEIQRLDAGLKDSAANMGEFQRNVGNYAIAAQGANESSIEWSKALEGIAGKLGVNKELLGVVNAGTIATTGAVVAGATAVIGAAKAWADYNEELAHNDQITRVVTGLQGEGAEAVTDAVMAIADSFNVDFRKTIESVNSLMQHFGLSAAEAVQMVRDGMQGMVMGEGDKMNDMVTRYAASLHDMGVSASELVAIIHNTQGGMFKETDMRFLEMGVKNIRLMKDTTKDALRNIGVDADAMQKKLSDGSMSIYEALGIISAQLQGVGASSQEAGEVLQTVFGRSGTQAGTDFAIAISELNTNLEETKTLTGGVNEKIAELSEAEEELHNVMRAIFGNSAEGWEEMKVDIKTKAINAIVGLANGCISLYNELTVVRGAVALVGFAFKAVWDIFNNVGKSILRTLEMIGDEILAVAKAIEFAFQGEFSKANAELNKLGTNITKWFFDGVNVDTEALGNALKQDFKSLADTTLHGQISVVGDLPTEETRRGNGGGGTVGGSRSGSRDKKSRDKKGTDKKGSTEKDELSEQKKILDAQLAAEQQYTLEWLELRKKSNQLAMDIELAGTKLTGDKKEELREALQAKVDKQNEDDLQKTIERQEKEQLAALNQLEKERTEHLKKREEEYAAQAVMEDKAYQESLAKLKKLLSEGLITEEEYDKLSAEYAENYAIEKSQAAIKYLRDVLSTENLSAEERQKLEERLMQAEIDSENAMADATINANKRKIQSDKERMERAIEFAEKAAEVLGSVNDLAQAIFENKMSQIEQQEEALDEQYEADKERIQNLNDAGVISKEEADQRMAALDETKAAKEAEIEEKKKKIKEKQAKVDKANSIVQATISTALAVMNALSTVQPFPAAIAMAARAGAMGAMQIATIAAQPLPKYAKGTDSHKGGYAIVGDGGKQELVTFGGNAYVTPDTPTLVNLPRGAKVHPDALDVTGLNPFTGFKSISDTKMVVNPTNVRGIEQRTDETNRLLKMQLNQERRLAYDMNYRNYKTNRL